MNNGDMGRICPQATAPWVETSAVEWLYPYLSSGVIPNASYAAELTAPNLNYTVPADRDPRENEDCLFLDVYVPRSTFQQHQQSGYGTPVVVYIHGGGYVNGHKAETDPTGLITRSKKHTADGDGVIFVAMNYRLGAFGFLGGSAFSNSNDSTVANAALYDQRRALEWIQENIHYFGGDKGRVTVMGGSAGAGTLMQQIIAFGGSAKAPFQQAIPQSPGLSPAPTDSQVESTYNDFLTAANVSSLAELRALPTEKLIYANALQIGHSGYGSFTYRPVVDGTFVTEDVKSAFAHGRLDKSLRVMAAHNTNEALGLTPPTVSNDSYRSVVTDYVPVASSAQIDHIVNDLYPPTYGNSSDYTDIIRMGAVTLTEATFSCNTYGLARAVNQSYGYVFGVYPGIHGTDTAYVFFDENTSTQNSTLGFGMQDYILSFVVDGVPKPLLAAAPSMDLYGVNGSVVYFGDNGMEKFVDPAWAGGRCDWWLNDLYN
jgi:acetylcholinesterase